jgi:hypothetical protein
MSDRIADLAAEFSSALAEVADLKKSLPEAGEPVRGRAGQLSDDAAKLRSRL